MCGIAGYWNLNELDPPSLCSSLQHRGPDGHGSWSSEKITLYHSRLSVIDLSESAAQPMVSDSKVAVSFNGEIYNYKVLRKSLEETGHKFRSDSDTEVILKLYLEYGIDFIEKLRGMFSIALYDGRETSIGPILFLIRDYFGIKPLLYSEQGPGVVFGSEIKALLDSKMVSKEIDSFSLRELLAVGCVYQPRTILKEVKAVSSGSYLQINSQGLTEKRWWDPTRNRIDFSSASDAEIFNKGEDLLLESGRQHLQADIPVSILLSGGLDSSLLTAMISRHTNERLDTFTVGFQSNSEIDERQMAKVISKNNGTNHHEITLDVGEIEETLFEFIDSIDQPTMDGFNTFLVSRSVSEFSKVTISGTGGDELFAGYPWFRLAESFPGHFDSGLLSSISRRYPEVIQNFPSIFHRFAYQGKIGVFNKQNQAFGFERARKLIKLQRISSKEFSKSFLDFESRDLLKSEPLITRLAFLCLEGYTKNQLLRDIDIASMHFSLEVRLPFLDIEVFNFASSLPDRFKLTPATHTEMAGNYSEAGEKYILGEISKKYLPSDFLERKKQGFSLPLDEWLRGPLSNLVEAKLLNNSSTDSLGLSASELSIALDEFRTGSLPAIKIWLLLVLILWYEKLNS
jgi:asparagine synthase (glutamine-hydrolysing)